MIAFAPILLAVRGFLKAIPWQVWLGVGIVVVGFFYIRHVRNVAYERGRVEEIQRIERANEEARRQARDAIRRVDECPDGKWNRETGKCEQ